MKKILNIESFSKLNDGRVFIRGTNSDFDIYSDSEIKSFYVGEKILMNQNGYSQKVKILDCYVIEVFLGGSVYDIELYSLSFDEMPVNVSLYEE